MSVFLLGEAGVDGVPGLLFPCGLSSARLSSLRGLTQHFHKVALFQRVSVEVARVWKLGSHRSFLPHSVGQSASQDQFGFRQVENGLQFL